MKVNDTTTKPIYRRHSLWVWLVFVAISALYLFSSAASCKIPFGPPIRISEVAMKLSWGDLMPCWEDGLVLGGAALVIIFYTSCRRPRFRLFSAIAGLLFPLAFFCNDSKSFAQYLWSPVFAPVNTIEAISGTADGEFYSDGMLSHASLGWWLILCSILLAIQGFRAICVEGSKEGQPATGTSRPRKDEAQR